MDTSEFYTYEDRAYIQPTLSSGEQGKFIDNLRDIQKQNTAQIAEQTYNLGTQVPSNLGGLGGGESYFTSRYQTPQTNEMVQTLKSAAQAQALNDILSNYQAQLKNKYSQAQRAYTKRERARQRALQNAALAGNNTGNITGKTDVNTGDTPGAIEGLAWNKYAKENGYSTGNLTWMNPSIVAKNTGTSVESVMKWYEQRKKQQQQQQQQKTNQQSALQPGYSGQLILKNN